jgi:transmembrane sensor
MENEEIKILLVKYITGEADESEIYAVKHWISQHPENEQYFIQLYETWQNMLLLKPDLIDEKQAYKMFLAKVAPAPVVKKYYWARAGALMATACLLVLIISFYRKTGNTPLAYHVIEAKKGTTLKLTLNDSTLIYLNAGSKLTYEDGFGIKNRTVYLEGEAFFDIAHKVKNLPFIVNTKSYVIRDVGTRFNLKAYADDPVFETTVVGGEVSVEGKPNSNAAEANRIYLKPHQVLRIYTQVDKKETKEVTQQQNSYNEVQVTHIDSAKLNVYDGWKDNLLVFDDNTLAEIARVLARRYDVTIAINSVELQNIRYSGNFKNIPDIDKVLHIIKQNTPINYKIEGQKITITKTN